MSQPDVNLGYDSMDAEGTTPWMEEGESRLEQQSSAMQERLPSDSACAPEGITRQIQEQSPKYSDDADQSSYATLTQPNGLLPENWANVRLGDYLFLKNGFAFKSNAYVDRGDNTFPVIRISNINGKIATDSSAAHIKPEVVAEGFEIDNGDLLIAMSGATTGKVGIYRGNVPAYQNQRVGNLKLHIEHLGSKGFRNYLIISLSPQILKIAYGGAQPNISGKAIEDIEITLPPLAEQQQIAAKLDELLAQVDNIKTRLDAIPKILKRFRQSVLAAAVSGWLTEDWREINQQNNGWKETTINELTESSFYGPRFSKNDYTVDGIPTIRTTDMTETGLIVVSEETPRVNVPIEKIEQYRVKPLDLLVTRTGSIGVMAIFKGDYLAIPSAYLIRFRFAQKIDVNFIYYFLMSPIGQREMGLSTTAITQPNINAMSIRAIKLGLPCLKEQTEIVSRVEQLFTYAGQIEQRVKDAQARVNHLTQTILAKAFRGELTAEWRKQNPGLISGENSAEALLARIKAEREASKKQKK